jgi:hypothetical protein
VISKDNFVEEGPQEAPCASLKDDKVVENFVVYPQEENIDK